MIGLQTCESCQSIEGQALTPVFGDSTFVDIAHSFECAKSLLAEVEGLGVVLSIDGDGIVFDASVDVMSSELLSRLRSVRSELYALLADRDRSSEADPSEGDPPALFIGCRSCGVELPADQANGSACERCAQTDMLANSPDALSRMDEFDVESQLFAERTIPCCALCGKECNVQRLDGVWKCSQCDPETRERRQRTQRILKSVQSILQQMRRQKNRTPKAGPLWYRDRLEEEIRRTGRGTDAIVLIDLAPSTPCLHCGSVRSYAVPIHDGQSVRRDCSGCGRYLDNPVWYDRSAASEWLVQNACRPRRTGRFRKLGKGHPMH
jgi:hypothetical protein